MWKEKKRTNLWQKMIDDGVLLPRRRKEWSWDNAGMLNSIQKMQQSVGKLPLITLLGYTSQFFLFRCPEANYGRVNNTSEIYWWTSVCFVNLKG